MEFRRTVSHYSAEIYRKVQPLVEVSDENRCPSDTQDFLSNVTNKQNFIKYLGELLVENGFKVVTCERDADTTIVKEALNTDGSAVTVIADDTDMFCLLLHHMCEERTTKKFIMIMKTEKKTLRCDQFVILKNFLFKMMCIIISMFFSRTHFPDAPLHQQSTECARLKF